MLALFRAGDMMQLMSNPVKHLFSLLALLLVLASAVSAQDSRQPVNVAALGPQVGETVPDFSLPDQNGVMHSRDSLGGARGMLLLFHRSADW